MRVFLGCGDVASFLTRLAPALGGHERIERCYLFSTRLHPHYANPYLTDHTTYTPVFKPIVMPLVTLSHHRLGRTMGMPLLAIGWFLLRLLLVVWAVFKVDAFLFVSGKSLLPFGLDARLFRLLGKRVVHIYLGTASRPRFMSARWEQDFDTPAARKWLQKLRRRIQRQAARLRRNGRTADIVIDNPLCGHYHEAPFVDWFHVGFPGHIESEEAIKTQDSERNAVRILHCPSVPRIKGSAEIASVIESLKSEGHAIEFIQLTGVPRKQVLDEISQSDFVIDQLYSDSPLAGFASEAAERKRLAVVGGYGWQALEKWMPEGVPRRGLCEPQGLKALLESLLSERENLPLYGQAAFEFVSAYWSEAAVAERMFTILQGGIPDDWYCNPAELDYFLGLGADKAHRLRVIHALVDTFGEQALGPVSDGLLQALRSEKQ